MSLQKWISDKESKEGNKKGNKEINSTIHLVTWRKIYRIPGIPFPRITDCFVVLFYYTQSQLRVTELSVNLLTAFPGSRQTTKWIKGNQTFECSFHLVQLQLNVCSLTKQSSTRTSVC